jgi:tripartite-type tricarboxylate transporter receptor subunit TctC
MNRREFISLVGGAAVAGCDGAAGNSGQDYPSRSITLIVNFPPGGSTDAMARIIREPLSQTLGQSITIDNRGGAGGTTGAAAVANAKPDGYTLLLGQLGVDHKQVPTEDLPVRPEDGVCTHYAGHRTSHSCSLYIRRCPSTM